MQKKILIIFGVFMMMTGCVSPKIQQKIEEQNAKAETNELYTDERLLNQVSEINRLFKSDYVNITGAAVKLKGDFGYDSLHQAVTEKGHIDWQIRANTPKYISEVEILYNLDGNMIEFNMIKKRKYAAKSPYHIVEKHLKEEHKNRVFYETKEEDDGYQYVMCSVCDSYMGSYGQRFSEQFAGQQTDWENYDVLLKWFAKIEKEALEQKVITNMGETGENEYVHDSFYYRKNLLLDGVMYSYAPFSSRGVELLIGFLPDTIYYPTQYKNIIDQYDNQYMILADYKRNGKMETLEYKSIGCYYEEEFETYSGSGRFQLHNSMPPALRTVIAFDRQQNLQNITVHKAKVSVDIFDLTMAFYEDMDRLLAVFDLTEDDERYMVKIYSSIPEHSPLAPFIMGAFMFLFSYVSNKIKSKVEENSVRI